MSDIVDTVEVFKTHAIRIAPVKMLGGSDATAFCTTIKGHGYPYIKAYRLRQAL
jgi:hypothetical protein